MVCARMARLLIVEDNHDLANLLVDAAQHRGHQARAVYTGQEAIGLLGPGAFDAAVVDLLLPDLRGTAVLDALRAQGIAAVAVSGVFKSERFSREATEFHGALAFFEKPFELSALLASVEELCSLTPTFTLEEQEAEEPVLELMEVATLDPSAAVPPPPPEDAFEEPEVFDVLAELDAATSMAEPELPEPARLPPPTQFEDPWSLEDESTSPAAQPLSEEEPLDSDEPLVLPMGVDEVDLPTIPTYVGDYLSEEAQRLAGLEPTAAPKGFVLAPPGPAAAPPAESVLALPPPPEPVPAPPPEPAPVLASPEEAESALASLGEPEPVAALPPTAEAPAPAVPVTSGLEVLTQPEPNEEPSPEGAESPSADLVLPFAERERVWGEEEPVPRDSRRMLPAWCASGELGSITVPRLLTALREARATGELKLRQGTVQKVLYFHQGRLVFAASNLAQERFGRFCVRRGVLSEEQLQQASALAREQGLRTGEALQRMGVVDAQRYRQLLVEQVREIGSSLVGWSQGTYGFSRPKPPAGLVRLAVSPGQLVLEGIQRQEPLVALRQRMPPERTLSAPPDRPYEPQELNLSPGHAVLLAQADGSKTVEDLLALTDLSEREVLATLRGLELLGMLEERAAPPSLKRISFGL
jgi:CheY-like chemotaxis protein